LFLNIIVLTSFFCLHIEVGRESLFQKKKELVQHQMLAKLLVLVGLAQKSNWIQQIGDTPNRNEMEEKVDPER
jgi:hypothetical protein